MTPDDLNAAVDALAAAVNAAPLSEFEHNVNSGESTDALVNDAELGVRMLRYDLSDPEVGSTIPRLWIIATIRTLAVIYQRVAQKEGSTQ